MIKNPEPRTPNSELTRNPEPGTRNPAYLDGLKMLARRELSEAQVRRRLTRKQHDEGDIDAAIERLRAERAIDDERVAEAIARKETSARRGRLRVRIQIERAGIARGIARHATDAAFATIDDEAYMEASLQKRLRGRGAPKDDRELQRLHRYLVGQGFDPDRVLQRINRLRRAGSG